jgi:Zn-finger nucleic acid-binding protein
MECPHCRQGFDKRLLGSVEVSECPSCGGMWISERHLQFAKDETDPDLNWMDFDLWKNRERFRLAERTIACPSCDDDLTVLDYGDTGVQVDYCDSCRGVWLDAGEFEAIIEALRRELLTKSVPGYVEASLKEARDLVTSEEGLLSDWKDLHTVLRMLKYRIMSRSTGIVQLLADLQSRNPVQ